LATFKNSSSPQSKTNNRDYENYCRHCDPQAARSEAKQLEQVKAGRRYPPEENRQADGKRNEMLPHIIVAAGSARKKSAARFQQKN